MISGYYWLLEGSHASRDDSELDDDVQYRRMHYFGS